ncbi:translocation/assembly module TamB [bacterium]|nr:translocation/assembly module TamB [bacterium]
MLTGILGGAFGLLILLSLLIALLFLPAVQQALHHQAVKKLDQLLPGRVLIHAMQIDARFRVRAEGVQWLDEESQVPLILCDTLTVRLSLFRIFSHELPVTGVTADGLVADSRLMDRLSAARIRSGNAPDEERPEPPALRQCDFRLDNGTAVWHSPDNSHRVVMRQISGWLILGDDLPVTAHIDIGNCCLHRDTLVLDLGSMTGAIQPEHDGIRGSLQGRHDRFRFGMQTVFQNTGQIRGTWSIKDMRWIWPFFIPKPAVPADSVFWAGDFSTAAGFRQIQTQSVIRFAGPSPLVPDSVSFSGTWTKEAVQNMFMQVHWLGGEVRLAGEIGLDSSRVTDCTLSLDRLSLAPLWRGIRHSACPFTGVFQGTFSGSGPGLNLKEWQGQGHLNLESVTYLGESVSPMRSVVRFSPDSASFNASQGITVIKGHYTHLESGPLVDFKVGHLRTRLLAPWINLSGFRGMLSAEGRLNGTWQNPAGIFRLSSDKLFYHFISVDTLRLDGRYRDGRFVIDRGTLAARSVEPSPDDASELVFLGDIALRGNVSGPLDMLKGCLDINGRVRDWAGFRADTLHVQAILDSGNFRSSAVLETDTAHVVLEGYMALKDRSGRLIYRAGTTGDSLPDRLDLWNLHENTIRLSTGMDGVRLSVIPAFYKLSPRIEGKLHLDGSAEKARHPDFARVDFRGEGLKLGQFSPDSLTGTYRYAGGQSVFSAALFYLRDSVSIQAEMRHPVRNRLSRSPLRVRLTGQIADTSPYIRNFAPHVGLTGRLNINLWVTGSMENPSISGRLLFDEGRAYLNQVPDFARELRCETHFFGDSLFVGFTGILGEIPFTLRGHWIDYLHSSGSLDLNWVSGESRLDYSGRIKNGGWTGHFEASQFRLRSLRPFLPAFEGLDGDVNAFFSFEQDQAQTDRRGYIRVEGVEFSLKPLPFHVEQGNLLVSLDENTLKLDHMQAQVNQGSVNGSGEFSHQRLRLLKGAFSITGTGIRLYRPDVYQIVLDTLNAGFIKDETASRVSGAVTLGKSRFIETIRFKDIPRWLDQTRRPWRSPSEFQKSVQLNIQIRQSAPFWIDNNLARMKCKSRLAVYGTLAAPYMMGDISVQEGYVLYLDRKFEIKQAALTFVKPESPYPEIVFSGENALKSYHTYSRKPYTVTLHVTGPVNRPQVQLQSEPPLSESDIFTLLTLGATRQELTRQQSEKKGSQLTDILQDRLAMISSQQVSSYATKSLGNMFGLENVAVEGNLFNFGKSWGPQLLASKKLSDRLVLTYKSAVGQSNNQEIRLDYRLTKKISLEGQTDQEGKSGIDLQYELRF